MILDDSTLTGRFIQVVLEPVKPPGQTEKEEQEDEGVDDALTKGNWL